MHPIPSPLLRSLSARAAREYAYLGDAAGAAAAIRAERIASDPSALRLASALGWRAALLLMRRAIIAYGHADIGGAAQAAADADAAESIIRASAAARRMPVAAARREASAGLRMLACAGAEMAHLSLQPGDWRANAVGSAASCVDLRTLMPGYVRVHLLAHPASVIGRAAVGSPYRPLRRLAREGSVVWRPRAAARIVGVVRAIVECGA